LFFKKIEINSEDYFKTFRGEEMKKNYTNLLAFLVFLLSSTAMLAQSGVGKISGKIIDADTKEPLIGANIILMNTNLGAATDIDGNYFILNITPGTYDVKVSYVGYAPKTYEDVRIVANITYELNGELSTDFTLPDIVVIDKKFFEAKSTNTVKVMDSEQISRLPVRGVANLVSLQSGVVVQEGNGGQDGNAQINVRGGRSSEVVYIVDGVVQNNLYNRQTVSQVSNAAIDQISFQVGGYEAKYGQAQSGIVNVTTKSGDPYYNIFADLSTSGFTDDYGANLYSGSISGPIIPGIPEYTIFLSGERGWWLDADPPAVPIIIKTNEAGDILENPITLDRIPNNQSNVWRWSGKISTRFDNWTVQLSTLMNDRVSKNSTNPASITPIRQYKNASQFIEEIEDENYSYSARISQTLSNNTFWNINAGYRLFQTQRYNPFLKGAENQILYGDSLWWADQSGMGVHLLGDGQRTAQVDANGVYRPYGWSLGLFQQREDASWGFDADLTSQLDNHLLEFGFGGSWHTVRGYGNYAYTVAATDASQPDYIRFAQNQPFVFGYDATGTEKTTSDYPASLDWLADPSIGSDPSMAAFFRPREPFIGYLYLQDRFELQDLVLNLGVRMDYFDIKSYELINPELPYYGGSNPTAFDIGDFKIKDVEVQFSPRIGLGFPVTESTVFHAQYGRFIQVPELNDMYGGPFDYNTYITMSPQSGFNGSMLSEQTTQYEVGFRQLIGNNAALNITAFYKNTKSLVDQVNSKYQRVPEGEVINAIGPQNTDFGTIKGFAFSFDVTRLSYLSLSLQYTLSNAEGTGSSTNSSFTSVFRNLDNEPPKVIAPLGFDVRHTAIAIVDFYIPEGELGGWELLNANFIFSFSSGRPYTPVDQWYIIGDNGLTADNTGYVNSAYGPGSFRIDLKLEKGFKISNFYITPYVWIQNLLDANNVNNVYRSTGSPYSTGWLNDPDAQGQINTIGQGYVDDYESIETDPRNFGIPRLINLGVKLNFDRINF
jgi:outer membrane receptor protein involved in Fe transport